MSSMLFFYPSCVSTILLLLHPIFKEPATCCARRCLATSNHCGTRSGDRQHASLVGCTEMAQDAGSVELSSLFLSLCSSLRCKIKTVGHLLRIISIPFSPAHTVGDGAKNTLHHPRNRLSKRAHTASTASSHDSDRAENAQHNRLREVHCSTWLYHADRHAFFVQTRNIFCRCIQEMPNTSAGTPSQACCNGHASVASGTTEHPNGLESIVGRGPHHLKQAHDAALPANCTPPLHTEMEPIPKKKGAAAAHVATTEMQGGLTRHIWAKLGCNPDRLANACGMIGAGAAGSTYTSPETYLPAPPQGSSPTTSCCSSWTMFFFAFSRLVEI